MAREAGFYWVRYRPGENWIVAEYKDGNWFLTDREGGVDFVAEIGPRIQPPNFIAPSLVLFTVGTLIVEAAVLVISS